MVGKEGSVVHGDLRRHTLVSQGAIIRGLQSTKYSSLMLCKPRMMAYSTSKAVELMFDYAKKQLDPKQLLDMYQYLTPVLANLGESQETPYDFGLSEKDAKA